MKSNPLCIVRLENAGIASADAWALRRISMTLQSWFEYECGTNKPGSPADWTYSIERDGDEDDSQPYMRVQYPSRAGYVDKRWKIPDRETGARKRLAAIIAKYKGFSAYVQTDCRGASVYILRPGDLKDGQDPHAYYTNGIPVYK